MRNFIPDDGSIRKRTPPNHEKDHPHISYLPTDQNQELICKSNDED